MSNSESEPQKKSWWSRLRHGLKKSSDRLGDGIKSILTKRKLDQETVDELEELLITSDLGVETAGYLANALAKERMNQDVSVEEVKEFLANSISEILQPIAKPLEIKPKRPHVVLIVGVNGSGKTTTIGKLAKLWQDQGLTVHMAAGDTFRAAAVEQLQVWGKRLNVPVLTRPHGADAAGLAYDALVNAKEAQADVLLIDTAGRLHNKTGLMEELKKIVRVLSKVDPEAPHSTVLILDATTGQNAHNQVQTFHDMVGLTGLVMTKLDGTARGGVVVALARKFNIPIHALGVGETVEDLRPFTPTDFARNLVGLDEQ